SLDYVFTYRPNTRIDTLCSNNAVVTVPILFIVMRLANDKKILEDKINTRFSNIIGWFTFAIMLISVIVMFLSFFIW
ncbi:MAG: hypothetical protein QOA17_09795, partial [Nitrososphaeraceae archaeon]|nr:hypothetical protein [Nitrososphaeraceae archaeon]